MELITTDDYFILQPIHKGENNLWISRHTGQYEVRHSWDLASQDNPECLGLVWGLVGKIRPHPDLLERLVLVRHCERIGELPGPDCERHGIYKVMSVAILPITTDNTSLTSAALRPCPKHHANAASMPKSPADEPIDAPIEASVATTTSAFAKIGGSLKTLATDAVKTTAGNAVALASQVKAPFAAKAVAANAFFKTPNVSRILERFERRILDEFAKLFNLSDSFYFSFSGDLSNTIQRQSGSDSQIPLWRRFDDRFFFNKHLLNDLTSLEDSRADPFILPFIQGFVEIKFLPLSFEPANPDMVNAADLPSVADSGLPDSYMLALISRRSRHRAGTRYKRRGADADGFVANFVETEQILEYNSYCLSFVLTRGSVPVHWSQPGYRYRPPPKLDKTEAEDQEAFAKHFETEMKLYATPIVCVSLIEKMGRERLISEAFLDRALELDNPDLTLVIFDFHEHCKGMHFENVSILLKSLKELIKGLRYCWMDKHGVVCKQQGVIRVNCIDCLDRTNVVQMEICRAMLEMQLTKLGVFPPDVMLPAETKLTFQGMWANNGDIISKQYAGTNALKGDFTRTGERNLSGLMKDGVNSASRYYLNQFRDHLRQAAIDLLTGSPISEAILNLPAEEELQEKPGDSEETNVLVEAEQVRALIEDCKKLLISDNVDIVGAWGLIDNHPVTGDLRQDDMDVILILTNDSYFLAFYDDEIGKVTHYQKVLLTNVERIEFGLPESSFNLAFTRSQTKIEHSLRLLYKMPSQDLGATDTGYFHMLRSTNLRFFNNMAVVAKTDEERVEALKSIADSIGVAMELSCPSPPDMWFGKLEKRKPKIPELEPSYRVFVESPKEPAMSVRSKMASMTSQFSRLNPMNRLKVTAQKSAPPDPTPEDEGGEAIKANPEPLPPSPSLSPNLSGQRFQSKSSEDLPSEVVVSSEEAPAAKDQFLSPFAKITSGFKIMTTAGGQGQEAPEQDPFYQKVIHSKSKTKVLLL